MALVLPDKAIPALFAQFEDDLQPSHLEFIGADTYFKKVRLALSFSPSPSCLRAVC